MNQTILVLGGTGMLGQPVARCLKAAGFQVRIMTRDPQKARPVFKDSYELAAGDPADIHCLEEALDGCYGVHISLPTEIEQPVVEMVANVASRHGVQRISYISGATVGEENRWFPMNNRKFLAEKALRDGDTPFTIFCPTWVMESLALFVVGGRAALFGKQPCPYHWVAAEDCARMVAAAYGRSDTLNQRFILHGPQAIRMDEALRRYCAALHPEITKVSAMPFWLVKVLALLTRDSRLSGAGELMAYFEKVGEGTHRPEANCILGTPSTTLDQWLAEKKAHLASQS